MNGLDRADSMHHMNLSTLSPSTPGHNSLMSIQTPSTSASHRRPNTANAATQNPQVGTRFIASCNRCRRRKIKCDPGIPSCRSCSSSNSSCEYHDSTHDTDVPRATLIGLEQHLRMLIIQQATVSGQPAPENPEFDLRGKLVVSGIRLACTFCRKRKIKCDGTAPCSGCTKFGKPDECSILYEEASSQGRSYILYLEEKIKKLEQDLQHVQPARYEAVNRMSTLDPSLMHPQENLPRTLDHVLVENTRSVLNELQTLSGSSPAILSNPATLPMAANTWSFRQAIMSFAGFQDETGPLTTLPGKDMVQPLVQHFLRHVYAGFPFVQSTEIHRSLEKYYAGTATANEQVLVLMIMAIAASYISTTPESLATYNALRLFSTATQLAMYDPDSLDGLKMNLLMVQFATLNPSKLNAWYLSGITMRACASLGLHKDSAAEMTESRSSHSRNGSNQSSPGLVNSALELREDAKMKTELFDSKKRLFWAAYIYDRSLSISTGRPCGFDDSAISVGLPSGFKSDIRSEPVIVILQRLRAINVQSRIYQAIHQTQKVEPNLQQIVQQFQHELDEWSVGNDELSPESTALLRNEFLYAQVLLYRPSSVLPQRSAAELDTLATSVLGYIHLNTRFVREQKASYFSHTKISQLFTAGIALMFVFTQPELRQRLQTQGAISEIQISLTDVAVGLCALVHRWQIGFDLSSEYTKVYETFTKWTTNQSIPLPSRITDFKNHKLGRLEANQKDSADWSGLMKRLLMNENSSSKPQSQASHTPVTEPFEIQYSTPSRSAPFYHGSRPQNYQMSYSSYQPHQPDSTDHHHHHPQQYHPHHRPHQPALTPLQQLAATATEHRIPRH